MGESFEGWTSWVEGAYLLNEPGDPECLMFHYIPKTKPELSVEAETAKINEQINESEGFDIDFSMFRCLFNYHLVDPDDSDFVDEPKTNGEFMDNLSRGSLDRYNQNRDTKFEFRRFVKTNFHWCCGYMFLITFEALDPSDNQEKPFQARVRYTSHYPSEYVFCRLKGEPSVYFPKEYDSDESSDGDDCDEDISKEDVKVECDEASKEDDCDEDISKEDVKE